MGNSATFLMLDCRDTTSNLGLVLLNVYSDDGLGATSNEAIWTEFMTDCKKYFDLKEKDPYFFLGAGIIQDANGAIHLDPSKYIRETVSKYDLD